MKILSGLLIVLFTGLTAYAQAENVALIANCTTADGASISADQGDANVYCRLTDGSARVLTTLVLKRNTLVDSENKEQKCHRCGPQGYPGCQICE